MPLLCHVIDFMAWTENKSKTKSNKIIYIIYRDKKQNSHISVRPKNLNINIQKILKYVIAYFHNYKKKNSSVVFML